MWRLLGLLIVTVLNIRNVSAATDKVFCYYQSWVDNFTPDDIDVNVCTHILYSFLGINDDGTLRVDDDWNNIIGKLSDLKNKNSNLKVLFSVGGWSEGGSGFSTVAADSTKKDTLVADAISLCQKHNYDGLDIDWEYPGDYDRGGSAEDRDNFIDMLKKLKSGFQDHGYLLTAAVGSDVLDGYNVEEMTKVLDYINLMTYDFHNGGESKTAENAPLYPRSGDDDWDRQHLNVQGSVQNWLNNGASPDKLILGLAFYGIQFTLSDPSQNGMGAPTTGEDGGQIEYFNICQNSYEEAWDDEQKVPYRYSGSHWLGYDNAKSIGLKVEFAKANNLGGVMMWSVDQDMTDGSCTSLLQTIKNSL